MPEKKDEYVEIDVPFSLATWLADVGRRAGAPAHRVIDVLLDRYIHTLPPETRRRFDAIMRRRDEPNP
jgi:hypothetical protein